MKKYHIYLFVIITLLIATALSSCNSQKRTERQLMKAEAILEKHPEVLAGLCAEKYPPKVTEGKTDTIYPEPIFIPGDSIPCPDGTKVKAPDVVHQCPASTHTRDTIINTAEVEKWKLFSKASEVDKGFLNGQLQETRKTLSEAKKEAQNRGYAIMGLSLLLVLALAYIVYGKFSPISLLKR